MNYLMNYHEQEQQDSLKRYEIGVWLQNHLCGAKQHIFDQAVKL